MPGLSGFLKSNKFRGALLGGATGAAATAASPKKNKTYKDYLKGTGFGAGVGLYFGHIGDVAKGSRTYAGRQTYSGRGAYTDFFKRGPSFDEHLTTLGIPQGVKTKSEAKKYWRDFAMKHHPDRGGKESVFKKGNEAWEEVQKSGWFQKLAFPSVRALLLSRLQASR